MLPNIYTQLSNSDYTIPNTYLLYGEIEDEITEKACQWIYEANLENKHPNLHLIINSVGGSLTSAWSLIDFMATSHIPVSTYGVGQALSAGLLLLMSGKKGGRFASENLSLMSHQFAGGLDEAYHNLNSMQNEFRYTHKRYLNHYVKCTGLTRKVVEKKLLSPTDTWLTPEEALKFNLIDEIFAV